MALPVVARVDSLLELVPEDQDKKLPVIRRIVDAAAKLNVKPAPHAQVDVPKARRDIKSLLSQAEDGEKQAKGYAGVSKIARQAVQAFASMIPALERADHALNSTPVATLQETLLPLFRRSLHASSDQYRNAQDPEGRPRPDTGRYSSAAATASSSPPTARSCCRVYGKKDLWERGPDEEFTKAVTAAGCRAEGNWNADSQLLRHRTPARQLSLGGRQGPSWPSSC